VSPSATTNRRSRLGRRSQLPKQYLCRTLIAKRIHGIDLRKNLSTCVTSCPLQPQTDAVLRPPRSCMESIHVAVVVGKPIDFR
jgi:hypothetical protein